MAKVIARTGEAVVDSALNAVCAVICWVKVVRACLAHIVIGTYQTVFNFTVKALPRISGIRKRTSTALVGGLAEIALGNVALYA